MDKDLSKNNAVTLFIQASYLAFFISFIFTFRAITSISIAAIFLGGIIENRANLRSFFPGMLRNPFIILCALFYLLQFISLLYTTDINAGWDNIRLKSGLLFIPLAVYSTRHMNPAIRKRLFSWYCIILAAASLYCFVIACWKYTEYHIPQVFFYHNLARPLSQHGVYFSIFVFIALAYLLYSIRKRDFILNRVFHISITLFLSAFLLLLSSKLVIVFYTLCLLYYFILLFRKTSRRSLVIALFIVFIAGGTTVFLTQNPVSERFNDIFHGDIRFIAQDRFDKGDYFNGVQFRLLQWRLTTEILTENNSWITGVGPGDAQPLLNQQYISKNMYTGNPAIKGSKGFLDYNTHNQLLQSLLQTGISCAILFVLMTFSLIRMAWKKRSLVYSMMIILLIVYSLIESMFETQYGILMYTFFPLFLYNFDKEATS